MTTVNYGAHPAGAFDGATGLALPLGTASSPLVAAARAALDHGGGTVGVEGVHGGFDLGGNPGKGKSVFAASGGDFGPLTLVGLTPDAQVGSCSIQRASGNPGLLRFESLALRPSAGALQCLIAYQQALYPRCDVEMQECRLTAAPTGGLASQLAAAARTWWGVKTGDGPVGSGAKWGLRLHGAVRSVALSRCTFDGFMEHGLYCDNVQQSVQVLSCVFSDCGRTGVQVVNRESDGVHPSNVPSTPETAWALVGGCLFVNCSSYYDAAKGVWWANGSASTWAGFPGSLRLVDNRVIHTHPGGGGIVVWPDLGKVGSYLTADGYAIGDVVLEGNRFDLLSGAKAQRQAVMLGDARSVEWHASNVLAGTLGSIVLDHKRPVGAFRFVGYGAAKPSATLHGQVWREVGGKNMLLTGARIDALKAS